MEERVPIDWNAFDAAKDGRIAELLEKLPRESWAARHKCGYTLLHFACRGPNVAAVVALVQSGLVHVNARDEQRWTPVHLAASLKQSSVLEALCAAGADLRARDNDGDTPIDWAAENAHEDGGASVRVLMANGVRLRTVRDWRYRYITPELEAFERNVLRCRTKVAALFSVKKAGWDKFLLEEIAIAVWATRYGKHH